jgi:hypothetical protein
VLLLPALLPISLAAPGDVLFYEDWSGGTGAWRANDGLGITLIEATDDAGVLRTWQHETQLASGGRVYQVTPVPVVGGQTYCFSAAVHATAGSGAFVGFHLSDAAGVLGADHWLISMGDYADGYGGLAVPVSTDPNVWGHYSKQFTLEAEATHLVFKNELWAGAAPGAADFTAMRLIEGPCAGGPGPIDDTDVPGDTDPIDAEPSPTSRPVIGLLDPGFEPERTKKGCATVDPSRSGAALLLLLLPWLRRRRAAIALLAAACGGGPSTSDIGLKGLGVTEPPPFWIEPERPMSGGTVEVHLDEPSAASWSLTASGAGCGTIVGTTGTGPLDLSGTASGAGTCLLTMSLTPSDGSPAYQLSRRFEVNSSDPVLPPLEVVGGVWRPTLPGVPDQPEAPIVTALTGPTVFINGASLEFDVTVDTDTDLVALIVTFDGWEGGYIVPVVRESEPNERSLWDDTPLRVRVPSHYFEQNSEGQIVLGVRGLDRSDRLGAAQQAVLTGREVGTGDVQVGISWGSATDVDLHVVEPTGTEVYYGNPTSPAGAQLDLDSNAGCSIDGVNHENVFWPAGTSPDGDYTVRVNLYSGCEVGSATGSVTLTYCGEGSPRVESFSLNEGATSASWSFSSACGGGKRVSGRIRYQDFPQLRTRYGGGAYVPARRVTVRLVREEDGAVLASGLTDEGGRYNLPFTNDGTPGFRLEVQARADQDGLRQQVTTLDEELYIWQTEEVFDDSQQAVYEDLDMDIPESANGGALNVFDIGVRGSDTALAGANRRPDQMLTFTWTRGKKPGRYNASDYLSLWNTIRLAGELADPDVYDDWTIAHEYGHFVMQVLGTSGLPGGDHQLDQRAEPGLAWSEGWATWFATQVLQGSTYIDLTAGSASTVYDIETLPSVVPLGNEGRKLEGNVGEAVISAVLLDIADDLDEPKDTISLRDQSAWYVFRYPMRSGKTDRGASGADLVDFLDMWICADLGDVGASDTEGLRGNALGLHDLAYDFTPDCN